jgi:hypothetical protein
MLIFSPRISISISASGIGLFLYLLHAWGAL